MQLFKYVNKDEWITTDTPFAKVDDTTTANTTYICWDDTDEEVHIQRVNSTSNGYAKGTWDNRASLTYVAKTNYKG